eukprot:9661536-Alexandrium_andersonii.AAC.1
MSFPPCSVSGSVGPEALPYKVQCPARCGAWVHLNAKPQREGTSWPRIVCKICRASKRCGTLLHDMCHSPVSLCTCRLERGTYRAVGPVQRDLLSMF